MVHPGAAPLSEDEIQALRTTIERGDFETGRGALTERSPREDYFDTLSRIVKPTRRLKVVVDAGNGIAGLYGPELLRRIGCDVVELFCESDGSFPNHLPDPEDEHNVEDLKAKVVEVGADLGIAYDGDADRVGVIDERGQRHEADLILILLARDLLARHPRAKIVVDVKSRAAAGRGSPPARGGADHGEARPLAPQAQDARRPHPARRRGQRPHVLRRELLRRRRRHPRLVQDHRADGARDRAALTAL